MSDKEREGYNEEIEMLKKKVNKLLADLQFTERVKENLNQYNQACEELQFEKNSLLVELNTVREEK
jgi:hypothetical protein